MSYNIADIYLPGISSDYQRACKMLDSRNYQGVMDQLHLLTLSQTSNNHNDIVAQLNSGNDIYLLAISAYERGDNQALHLLDNFITLYPESPLVTQAQLAKADYLFFHHEYAQALESYNLTAPSAINPAQRDEYTYRKALCMLHRGLYSEAKPLFDNLSSLPSYKNVSLYYDAYIDYMEGRYDEAYSKFAKVEIPDSEAVSNNSQKRLRAKRAYRSSGIEPGYYMTQIEYLNGDYDNVISHGKALLQHRRVDALATDINRIIGLSYLKKGMLSNARGFLQNYFDDIENNNGDIFTNSAADARYAMGCILFDNGNYQDAASYFSSVVNGRSPLAQSAYLYLGQCAAEAGDDNAAAISFEKAAMMNFDNDVAEAARYNFIVSQLNGGNIPFRSSITLLEDFLQKYPDSRFSSDANQLLANAYFNETDYAKALESINRIPNPDKKIREAKQKILYRLGMTLASNSRPAEAIPYLSLAADESQSDKAIARQASLWLADAFYATHDYKAASKEYQKALKSSADNTNRALALYNLAYSQYMDDNFTNAEKNFSEALSASPALPATMRNDALIRQADCLYYSGNYSLAKTLYSEARKQGANDTDYIAFRNAMIDGVSGNLQAKLNQLETFADNFPDSKWAPDALLEAANSYAAENNFNKAIEIYSRIISDYPGKPQARSAMLNLAYSYTKAGDNKRAMESYMSLIQQWPTSRESAEGNEILRQLCAASDSLDDYEAFISDIPDIPGLDDVQRQELSFDAACDALAENPADTRLMQTYANRYPDGIYIAKALLALADACELTGTDANEAYLTWKKALQKCETGSLPAVYAGIMRTTANPTERIEYARRVQSSPGIPADVAAEAAYYEAIGLLDNGKAAEASRILQQLAANPLTLAGSKAAVSLGEYQVKSKQYKNAEKTLTSFTDSGTPHAYWLARGFIALADLYEATGKKYLAKEYLQSLKENYPSDNDDILPIVNKKLNNLK